MSTQKETLSDHEKRISRLEFIEEKLTTPQLKEVMDTLKNSTGGLKLVNLIDNRLGTVFAIGIVGIVIWFVATQVGALK